MRLEGLKQTNAPTGWMISNGDLDGRCGPAARRYMQFADDSAGHGPLRRDMLAKVVVEQQRIEIAVHTLASGLILAQEAERQRIAAELHDGINQDVAIIAIDLGLLAQHLPGSSADLKQEILRIQERTIALSNDVRNLSHHLHPAIVEHLGLFAAVRVYCREFERREGIRVELATDNATRRYPAKVELALYRICQEALCNTRRHSGAGVVRVSLRAKKRGLLLVVADDGCGFDVAARPKSDGMGLISMWERARLAGGNLVIRSQPNAGTEVEAFIPVKWPPLKRRTREQT